MLGVEGLRLSSSGGIVEAVIDRGDENLFTVEMCQALASTLLAPPEGAHILHLRAEGSAF